MAMDGLYMFRNWHEHNPNGTKRKREEVKVCTQCNTSDTPEWRRGPQGTGTYVQTLLFIIRDAFRNSTFLLLFVVYVMRVV